MIRQPVPARLADQDPYRQAHTAARHLRDLTSGSSHQIAVILGSGWAPVSYCLGTTDYETSLSELPGFVPATAPGHAGTVRSLTVPRSGKRDQLHAQIWRQVQHRAKSCVCPVEIFLLELGAGLVDPRQRFRPVVRLPWPPGLEQLDRLHGFADGPARAGPGRGGSGAGSAGRVHRRG